MSVEKFFGIGIGLWLLIAGVVSAFGQATLPATNTPLPACIEGRVARVVNGFIGCAQTASPTISSCGTSPSLSSNATDFIGRVTFGAGLLTACTISFTKLYPNSLGCIAQTNSGAIAVAGSPVMGTGSGVTTMTINLLLNGGGTQVTYICGVI